MDSKTRALWITLRAMALEFAAAVEDYLGIPPDESALYKRRKRKELT